MSRSGPDVKALKFHLLVIVIAACSASAVDILDVLPVTNHILRVHLREGHIDYSGYDTATGTYQPQTEGNVVYFSRRLTDADVSSTGAYSLTSVDDPAYAAATNPLSVGYRALGSEFNNGAETPQYVREWYVFLTLPSALVEGKTYAIHTGTLTENRKTTAFVFDVTRLRSPTIKVSQVGFTPDAPKYAYLSEWMGTAGPLDLAAFTSKTVTVRDAATGEVVSTYAGLALQKSRDESDVNPSFDHSNWSGVDVYSVNISDVKTPGRYVVSVEDIGCSWPFVVAHNAYAELYRVAMRSIFLQRRGIYKDLVEYDTTYPRSHHPDINTFQYGDVAPEGDHIDNPRPVTGVWGWYADAGDWDAYNSHWVMPFGMLLAYDLKPDNFSDGDIGNRWKEKAGDPWVDEGSNGLPDMLDEARWLVDFYRRAKDALVAQGLGTGGVPGYLGREAGAHEYPSWMEQRLLYVSTEEPEATYAYAGAAAYLAHNLNTFSRRNGGPIQHAQSEELINEAQAAFTWASERTSEGVWRLLASAALYVATGETTYQQIFKTEWERANKHGSWLAPSHELVAGCIFAYAGRERSNLDQSLHTEVKEWLTSHANATSTPLLNPWTGAVEIAESAYRFCGVESNWQYLLMNLFTIPRLFSHAVVYELTGERRFLDGMHNTMAYLAGGNQTGMTKLTGVGYVREQDAFVCDAWYLLDYNHKVYRNPIFAGYSVYEYPMFDVGGPGNEGWARSSALPGIDQWPISMQRMRSRWSIAGSEWTIHQNNIWYAFATGYLLGEAGVPRFSRPTVAVHLTDGDQIAVGEPFTLSVSASANTERVRYYYEWRYIGESADKANSFACVWDVEESGLSVGDTVLITAVAYDRKGEPTVPTPQGEATVTMATESVVAAVASPSARQAGQPKNAIRLVNTTAQRRIQPPAWAREVVLHDLRGAVVARYGVDHTEPRSSSPSFSATDGLARKMLIMRARR